MASGSRLVASTRTSSHAAAAPRTARRPRRSRARSCPAPAAAAGGPAPAPPPRPRHPGCSRTPSATATTAGTCAGSRTGASSASHAPSANWPATWLGHRAGQPGLPRSARPGHRHQPVLLQQARDLAHRTGPADETRQHSRETMHATRRGNRRRAPHAGSVTASRNRRTAQPRRPSSRREQGGPVSGGGRTRDEPLGGARLAVHVARLGARLRRAVTAAGTGFLTVIVAVAWPVPDSAAANRPFAEDGLLPAVHGGTR